MFQSVHKELELRASCTTYTFFHARVMMNHVTCLCLLFTQYVLCRDVVLLMKLLGLNCNGPLCPQKMGAQVYFYLINPQKLGEGRAP